MNRRDFLRSAALTSAALAVPFATPGHGFASQACDAPSQTPNGTLQRCTAGIKSLNFQAAYGTQQQDEWCWAACISMIFTFYGHPVPQARIVQETWGKVVNMPGQPNDILKDLNRTWKDDNGRTFRSQGDPLSANNFNAVKDLQNNQPLIIGSKGHATVLTALTGETNLQTGQWQILEAIVRDPWPTSGGVRVLRPDEWFNIGFAARVRVQ